MRLAALVPCLLLVSATDASAHIELTSPTPRTADQKIGPCGAAGSKRGTKVATYRPGETITVEWDETVDHPGHYRIALDDDGDDSFKTPSRPDDAFPQTLADQIVDRSGGGHYKQQITLPNINCTNCTLQLIQVMTTSIPYNSFYFQCADLVIGEGTQPNPADPNDPSDPSDSTDSSGCSTGSSSSLGLAAGLMLLGIVRRRHRR